MASARSTLATVRRPGRRPNTASKTYRRSHRLPTTAAANATTRPWFRALVCVSEYATLRARSLSPNAWRPTFTPRRRRSKKRTHERRASTELATSASASTSAFFSSGQEDGICRGQDLSQDGSVWRRCQAVDSLSQPTRACLV